MNAEPIPFPQFGKQNFIARFNHVKALGTKYQEAMEEWHRVFGEIDGRRAPRGSEQFYRDEVAKHDTWLVLNAAEKAYRAACDEFFFAQPRTGEGEAG